MSMISRGGQRIARNLPRSLAKEGSKNGRKFLKQETQSLPNNNFTGPKIENIKTATLQPTPSFKSFSSYNNSEVVVLVLGGTGHLGSKVVEGALKRNYQVYVTTRKKHAKGRKESDQLHFIKMSKEQMKNADSWREVAEDIIPKGKRILVVNAMGGAHPTPGETLSDLNSASTLAAFEGLRKGFTEAMDVSFVQFSSLAAELVEDEYGQVKRDLDQALLKSDISNLTILRVGYALEEPSENGHIAEVDNRHAYAPEQLAILPIQPMVGDGEQILQTTFTSDLVTATFNTLDSPGKRAINAVGKEIITQNNLIKFFCDLRQKKFRPYHMPVGAAEKLAKHFSIGHFAPYAIEYCKTKGRVLAHDDFEELLGAPTKTLEEGYQIKEGSTLVYAKPPLAEHAAKVFTTLKNSSEARKDTFEAIKEMALEVIKPTILNKDLN